MNHLISSDKSAEEIRDEIAPHLDNLGISVQPVTQPLRETMYHRDEFSLDRPRRETVSEFSADDVYKGNTCFDDENDSHFRTSPIFRQSSIDIPPLQNAEQSMSSGNNADLEVDGLNSVPARNIVEADKSHNHDNLDSPRSLSR